MKALRWLWTELTRPRGLGHRRRHSRSGVAILVVVVAVMVLTILVTELTYGARVRFLVAAHQRDRVAAYWLARSGFNIYRILLVANKELGKNSQLSDMTSQFGINLGDALWQMLPTLNTGLLRMLLTGDGDVSEEEVQDFVSSGQLSEEVREESREQSIFSDKNFLDFEGDFSAEVKDHESRVNVNAFAAEDPSLPIQQSATAQLLYALMSGEENDQWFHEKNLDRWELIANLKDWVDADSYRSGTTGGYEDNLYNRGDDPFMTKNAPFDTVDEIRVVDGWQGEVFDKFGSNLTVYGAQGKININTASPELINAFIRGCSETPVRDIEIAACLERDDIEMLMALESWDKPENFVNFFQNNCQMTLKTECVANWFTDSSQTFDVVSTGLVGTSSVTIRAVLDFSGGTSEGKLVYWRVD
jgi:type II secretory pathway component PulK